MKVTIRTVEGDALVHEASGGRLELKLREGDPEFPASFWLDQIVSLEVSEHPEPIVQGSPAAESEWVTPSRGEAIYGAATFAKLRELGDTDPRLAEPSDVRYRVPVEPKRSKTKGAR
jgi:hypothetical protein